MNAVKAAKTVKNARKATNTKAAFERTLAKRGEQQYVLHLYVTGMTPRSARAIANARAICDAHLQGAYDLRVIDVYQQPELAKEDDIIAVPTLVKKLPLPLRRIIGDLSDREGVLLGLTLKAKP
jgi:circadian clock protein KaiB